MLKTAIHTLRINNALLFVFAIPLLICISRINYLLFHSIIEILGITVCFGVFMLAVNTYGISQNRLIAFIGLVAFLIGTINIFHTLTYKGMGVFPTLTANTPTQLWIISRYVLSVSLLLAPFIAKGKLKLKYIVVVYAAITVYLLLKVLYFKDFVDCYIEGQGLTNFKIISEYIISLLFAAASLGVWRAKSLVNKNTSHTLMLVIISSIAAELFFTSYVSVYGYANLTGHIFIFLSYWFIYKAVVETNLIEPNKMMYYNLQAEIDIRTRAEEELNRVLRMQQLLSDSNEALVYAVDEKQLLNSICSIIVNTGGYRMAWIGFIRSGEGKKVAPVAQAGFDDGYLESILVNWDDSVYGRGPAGEAIKTGQPRVFRNIIQDDRYAPWRENAIRRGYHSSLTLPLMINDRIIGCLNIYSQERFAFNANEIDLLVKLTNNLAYGIKTLRNQERILYMRKHDRLTKLFNREFVENEIERLNDPGFLPVSVIMADINGLKLFNDVFGHKEGDVYIQEIANLLQASVRDGDILARWGGDEFVIIMPHTEEGKAIDILNKIKKASQGLKKEPIKLSLATGHAIKTNPGTGFDKVIRQAEDNMNRDKLLSIQSERNVTLSLLRKSLYEKNIETEEHAARLQDLSVKLGMQLGLSNSKLNDLSLLALLHDIGKIAIPETILIKPRELTSEEWAIIKRHTEIGYRIVSTSQELSHIADYILSHHERWDGTGYPRGLAGEEIPLLARIIAIVDTYDVLTHSRAYKNAVNHKTAMEEILRVSGSQFDPFLVTEFIEMMNRTLLPQGFLP